MTESNVHDYILISFIILDLLGYTLAHLLYRSIQTDIMYFLATFFTLMLIMDTGAYFFHEYMASELGKALFLTGHSVGWVCFKLAAIVAMVQLIYRNRQL